jgi:type IX secretion system PorP/SprF family membrane protein
MIFIKFYFGRWLLRLICLLGIYLIGQPSLAQDAQFSQFYANPLYINPALAGSGEYPRFMFNWRNQWPGLEVSFTTFSAAIDHYFDRYRSGLGLIYTSDLGGSGFRSQDIGLQYAYDLQINANWNLRAGMQGSFVRRDAQLSDLLFGDQLQSYLSTGAISPTAEQLAGDFKQYFNLSSGLFLYSEKYWLGLSVHNMTRPDQRILQFANNQAEPVDYRLPVRYTLQIGAKFPLVKGENYRDQYREGYRERSFTPTLLYKHQGSFDQLDIGAYFTLEPISFGLWYRGIPIKEYEIGIGNNEALIGLVGLQMGNFNFGYSYDFTISNLGASTGGAHEISLRFLLIPKTRVGTKKKNYKSFPCPKF